MKGKGTVIYIGGFELPDKNAAAHRVLSNAKIFKELGYTTVFVDVNKKLNFKSSIEKTNRIVQGFECWSVPYPKTKNEWIKYLVNIDSIITVCEKYKDIKFLVAYNYQAISLNRLRKYCKIQNIKIIADSTEWYCSRGKSIAYFLLKGLDTFYRMRIVQKKLDGLIVISTYLKKYYQNVENIIIIPPLVDIFENKWNVKKEKEKKEKEKIFLVYAGFPGRKDKINLLVEALRNTRLNYQLDIIGITKDQYRSIYSKKEFLGSGSESVIFHGYLNHLETLKYVKSADYTCFFRNDNRLIKAGFPTKFVESITCGVPVITNWKYDNCEENKVNITKDVILKEVFIRIGNCILYTSNKDTYDFRNYIGKVDKWLNKIRKSENENPTN